MINILYTIGYATKAIDIFIDQLKQYRIDVVVDVRSVPYSKVFHAYHKESIATHLKRHDIQYLFMGDELGPRSTDPEHYDSHGQVQFDHLMQSPLFEKGIQRLKNGLDKGFTIALMCAEKDPATCHRSLLIGYFLYRQGGDTVIHIDHEGNTESQTLLEDRLCDIHGVSADLFMSADEQSQHAYQLQLTNTSYRKDK